jgi:ribosomal RNA-processing protein 8
MFAVPGWSVSSANLKTQTTLPAQDVGSAKPPSTEATSEPTASNGKRNRSNGKAKPLKVNAANLADLWETVIEGKPKDKKLSSKSGSAERRKRKKEHKVRNQEDGQLEEDAPETAEGEDGSEPAQKKRKTKEEKKTKKDKKRDDDSTSTTTKPAATQLTPLQAAMRQKLISARFRHLNQALYTTPSAQSMQLFTESPEMFSEYHEGFRRQVEVWPENPVDGYVGAIRSRGMVKRGNNASSSSTAQPLPRTDGTCRIADLGCGDAALASSLQRDLSKLHLKIHSFDLSSSAETNKLITRADIAALPLPDDSIDVALFCLALMGTNWVDFVEEAFRVLRWKGELWVAEIKSRFGRVGGGGQQGKQKRVEHSVGKRVRKEDAKAARRQEEEADTEDLAVVVDGQDSKSNAETDVSAFVEVLRKRGFVLQGEADLENRMFVRMRFVKGVTPMKGKSVPVPKGMQGATGESSWVRKAPKNKGRFTEDGNGGDEHVSSEAAVLKPCVYKLR